jgi:transposase-like protein
VLRVLRGEDLDALSRELGVTASTIAGWRDQFLASGQAGLRSRPADERDEEIARLRAKVGEMTMANELLRERARRAGANSPAPGLLQRLLQKRKPRRPIVPHRRCPVTRCSNSLNGNRRLSRATVLKTSDACPRLLQRISEWALQRIIDYHRRPPDIS